MWEYLFIVILNWITIWRKAWTRWFVPLHNKYLIYYLHISKISMTCLRFLHLKFLFSVCEPSGELVSLGEYHHSFVAYPCFLGGGSPLFIPRQTLNSHHPFKGNRKNQFAETLAFVNLHLQQDFSIWDFVFIYFVVFLKSRITQLLFFP